MRIIIELDEDQSDATVIRMLKDAQRLQERSEGRGLHDHWIDLETPQMCLGITRIVGVVMPSPVAFGPRPMSVDVVPLGEL